MSPFCPGRTLSDCPSEYATAWRKDIRGMVGRGMTAAQIQDELERRAGANLSGSPRREVSYGVPVALSVFSFAVLGAVFLRLRKGRSGEGTPTSEPNAASALQPTTVNPAPRPAGPISDERLEAELRSDDDD
jgi:cytochrome c-type biogenesis protein CcmH/NrfF